MIRQQDGPITIRSGKQWSFMSVSDLVQHLLTPGTVVAVAAGSSVLLLVAVTVHLTGTLSRSSISC